MRTDDPFRGKLNPELLFCRGRPHWFSSGRARRKRACIKKGAKIAPAME